MFKALLDWLFGRRPAAAQAAAPAATRQDFEQLNRNAPLREAAIGDAHGEDGAATVTYLCREAVLGRDQRIAGYQFMLHEGTRNRIRHGSRRIHHLYAEVLVRNLVTADIGRLLGHRLAFIEIPDSFLSHPCLAELPARNIVLIPMPHAEAGGPATETLGGAMAQLRQAGFRFGLPDPMIFSEFVPLLPQADVIVLRAPTLDARRGLQLGQMLADAAPQARLLVRDLPSLEDFRFAFKLGANLFQGPFITSREDWSEHELGPNTARIATLIGRLRLDGDTREIAAMLKQDGALSLRLLRYVNSVAGAHAEPISSIEHTLVMLGHDRLYRWLVLLACSTDGSQGRAAAALETALVRARMMELLAEDQPVAQRESLFLVGLLSLADVIMQVPLEKALAPLALAPDVQAALRGGEGPLRPLLELAIACERGSADSEQLQAVAERCGVTPRQASRCHIQALLWAMDIQQ